MSDPAPGLSYLSETDIVVALICELIITGELPAGKQLRQRDLAALPGQPDTVLSLMRLLWQALRDGPRVLRTHAESDRQHDEIISALRRGDADAAHRAPYEHIMGATHLDPA